MPIGIVLQNVLVPLGAMAMVVLIVWLNHQKRIKRQDRQAELTRKLIDSFSSGEAFAEAVQGPTGSKLVDALAMQSEEPAKSRWPGLFIPASILTMLGLGFFVLAAVNSRGFLIPGIIVSAIGAALLLSTFVLWRVEKRDRADASAASGEGDDPAHARADSERE